MNATVQELVDALTPEEKAGLCTGAAVPRLRLPALRVNGLHSQESAGGVCFPSACAAAASFDPEAARRMGAALGREARSGGAQLLDVPDVNLKRGPLSGRSADTWAEDPCLTGALAAAFLQGVQSAGVGGCAGRLAVVNQETDRRTLNRRVDERTLQELYLPAFETAVRDGQPRAVVCSAGQLNGTRICEDTALLTDTLRGAWGFAGAVLAEPGAVQDPARTLAAGVDFAPADAGRLVDAVQSGALDESVLNRAASNIIRTLLAASPQPSPADRTADRSLAVELAKQSGVLLRNLGALPLHKGQKVAYIGAFADHPRYSAGHPRAPQVTSAIDAAVLHDRKIQYIEGFPADRDQRDEAEFLGVLDALGVHVADNSAKARRDDWVFSLAEEPSKKVSGERLGFVYGKEMLRRRFEREGAYRPTDASAARIREAAERALELNDLSELSRLSSALETCAKFDVESIEEFGLRMATLERRGQAGGEGYRRLEAARDYMAMNGLMPLKTRYGDDCGRGAAEGSSRDGRREDEQQRILAAERQRAQQEHRRERGRR